MPMAPLLHNFEVGTCLCCVHLKHDTNFDPQKVLKIQGRLQVRRMAPSSAATHVRSQKEHEICQQSLDQGCIIASKLASVISVLRT